MKGVEGLEKRRVYGKIHSQDWHRQTYWQTCTAVATSLGKCLSIWKKIKSAVSVVLWRGWQREGSVAGLDSKGW